MEDVYIQTWNRILAQPQKKSLIAKRAILWVLYAICPLSLDALRHLTSTCAETHKFEPNRLVPAATLIALCHGLLTMEEKTQHMRLVRESMHLLDLHLLLQLSH
jgi:hypothetical protein